MEGSDTFLDHTCFGSKKFSTKFSSELKCTKSSFNSLPEIVVMFCMLCYVIFVYLWPKNIVNLYVQ